MSAPAKTDTKNGSTQPAASKISLSLSTHSSRGLKRSRAAALQDDEEDDASHSSSVQRVSHFDRSAGGAIDASRPATTAAPLVIPRQANRDWRAAATTRKRQKSGLPVSQDDAGRDADAIEAADAAKKPGYGLTVATKSTPSHPPKLDDSEGGTREDDDDDDDVAEAENARTEDTESAAAADTTTNGQHPKTDDERAIDALLGRDTTGQTLVVPAQHAMTETEAFGHDFRSAPEMASLDDYVRVPVEQFGAAMLRGMGWKDGNGVGLNGGTGAAANPTMKKRSNGHNRPDAANRGPPVQRRAAMLGIGAKEGEAAVVAEMGAWGRSARGGKEVKVYNPLMMKDTRTGEMLTEEELEQQKAREEREGYEREFERREKEKERAKRGENGHRQRDDRERERRRHDDDRSEDEDEEYRRRKEKERRRRREREGRDEEHDRDQDRSRRHRERDGREDDYARDRAPKHRDRDDRDRYRDHDRHRDRHDRRR